MQELEAVHFRHEGIGDDQVGPVHPGCFHPLPAKYRYAILAAEIGSSLVYCGDREADFVELLKGHLARNFPLPPPTGSN